MRRGARECCGARERASRRKDNPMFLRRWPIGAVAVLTWHGIRSLGSRAVGMMHYCKSGVAFRRGEREPRQDLWLIRINRFGPRNGAEKNEGGLANRACGNSRTA
jgi:hypothetical protein